jgi:hypothetical protein
MSENRLRAELQEVKSKAADDQAAQRLIVSDLSNELKNTKQALAELEKNTQSMLMIKDEKIIALTKQLTASDEAIKQTRLLANESSSTSSGFIAGLSRETKAVRDILAATEQKANEEKTLATVTIAQLRYMLENQERRHEGIIAEKDYTFSRLVKDLKTATGAVDAVKAELLALAKAKDKLAESLQQEEKKRVDLSAEHEQALKMRMHLMLEKDVALEQLGAEKRAVEVSLSIAKDDLARQAQELDRMNKQV